MRSDLKGVFTGKGGNERKRFAFIPNDSKERQDDDDSFGYWGNQLQQKRRIKNCGFKTITI